MKKSLTVFLSLLLIGCSSLSITEKLEQNGWLLISDQHQVLSKKIDDKNYYLDLDNDTFTYENERVKYEVNYNEGIVTRLLDGSNYVSYDEKTRTMTNYTSLENINEDLIKDDLGKIWLSCKYDYLNHEFLDYSSNQKYTCIETGADGSEAAYNVFRDIILNEYNCTIEQLLSE